ncbi:MAG: nucleic acid-binding [Lasallia pustulata]|uniref:Nucleic acid-binding n=1 Tax=Lasallia pustulata TaxID=136370 RepID=A0A5M8PLA4_9LECA|nr:MAG: nucleic acid-binding [Lasallia pustulata]
MSVPASSSDSFLPLLQRSFPSVVSASTPKNEISNISQSIYPNTAYDDNEKIEVSQWLTTSSRLASPDEDEAKHAERLGSLNTHLSSRTTLLGSKPSVADIALYARLAPAVKQWTPEERTGEHGYHHIVRYIDFVQNAPFFGLAVSDEEKVQIDVNDVRYVQKPIDPKEEKERKKKEKAAAAAALAATASSAQKPLVVGQSKDQGANKPPKDKAQATVSTAKENAQATLAADLPAPQKREKGKTAQTRQTTPARRPPLPQPHRPPRRPHPPRHRAPQRRQPVRLDHRMRRPPRHRPHDRAPLRPNRAHRLLRPPGARPPRRAAKPRRRRRLQPQARHDARRPIRGHGAGRVAAAATGAADPHAGPVELVSPPPGARAGERVGFEGWGGVPRVLNPKKKVWEMCQVGFTTTEAGEVAFDAGAVPQLQGQLQGRGRGSGRRGLGGW